MGNSRFSEGMEASQSISSKQIQSDWREDVGREKKLRVCVVDDDDDILRTVERLCDASGFDVLGIREILGSSSKINGFKPHILLLDINMPFVQGKNLLGVFRKTLLAIPKVIMFSGIDPEELEQITKKINADDFFYKGDGLFRLMSKLNLYAAEMNIADENSRVNGKTESCAVA